MKIYLIIWILLLSAVVSKADIPNPYFEEWTSIGNGFDGPIGWETNSADFSFAVGLTGDAYKGSRALVLTSRGVGGAHGNPGIARTKFPLTGQPLRFFAFVRTQVHPGDEVYIRATLFSGGEAVDSVVWTAKSDISDWTRLALSFNNDWQHADSAEIYMRGGRNGFIPEPNEDPDHTWLTVDALSFEYAPPEARFYPNPVTQNDPANDFGILEFRGYNPQNLQLTILSADGRQHHLLSKPEDNQFRIESKHLAKGLYFYYLHDGQNPAQTGRFVIQ